MGHAQFAFDLFHWVGFRAAIFPLHSVVDVCPMRGFMPNVPMEA
jgi:hypothetical protein